MGLFPVGIRWDEMAIGEIWTHPLGAGGVAATGVVAVQLPGTWGQHHALRHAPVGGHIWKYSEQGALGFSDATLFVVRMGVSSARIKCLLLLFAEERPTFRLRDFSAASF